VPQKRADDAAAPNAMRASFSRVPLSKRPGVVDELSPKAMRASFSRASFSKRGSVDDAAPKTLRASFSRNSAATPPPPGGAKQRQRLLSPEQAQQQIAHIYQAFASAHAAAGAESEAPRYAMPRFDHFVVRYFRQLHGTSALAKRHASAFLASVQNLLDDGAAGEPLYPRAVLFAKVAGIARRPAQRHEATSAHAEDVVNRAMFNAKLMEDFVNRALLLLYGADEEADATRTISKRTISRRMRLVAGAAAVVERRIAVHAFAEMLGGFDMPGLLDESKDALLALLDGVADQEPSRRAFAPGADATAVSKDCVDVDAALWGLLRLYERGVKFEQLRIKVAERFLAAWVRKRGRPRGEPLAPAEKPQAPKLPLLDFARQGPPRDADDTAPRDADDAAGAEPDDADSASLDGATELYTVVETAAEHEHFASPAAPDESTPKPRLSPRGILKEAIAIDLELNRPCAAARPANRQNDGPLLSSQSTPAFL